MSGDVRLRLGVLGIGGRTGGEIANAIRSPELARRFELVASPRRGEELAPLLESDVVIEFSSPSAALELVELARKSKRATPIILASTGWTEDQNIRLIDLARETPVLRASNFSLGVLVARASLGLWSRWPGTETWKFSMREVHHVRKKDAPSGTALTLAEAIREASGRDAPIESVREGDVVGIHEVVFESEAERLVLVHEAKNRAVFALGALEAAARIVEKIRAKSLPRRLLSLDDLYVETRADRR